MHAVIGTANNCTLLIIHFDTTTTVSISLNQKMSIMTRTKVSIVTISLKSMSRKPKASDQIIHLVTRRINTYLDDFAELIFEELRMSSKQSTCYQSKSKRVLKQRCVLNRKVCYLERSATACLATTQHNDIIRYVVRYTIPLKEKSIQLYSYVYTLLNGDW